MHNSPTAAFCSVFIPNLKRGVTGHIAPIRTHVIALVMAWKMQVREQGDAEVMTWSGFRRLRVATLLGGDEDETVFLRQGVTYGWMV